jgi:DNA-binding beta-propeller fold protein YncE
MTGRIGVILLLTIAMLVSAHARDGAPLTLETTIKLDNVGGRIDHMAFDRAQHRLLIAALGNGTVEIVDTAAAKRAGTISGLAEPQGVAWSEQSQTIFVASAGDGSVRMFRANDLSPVGRIDLRRDADNIRIDPRDGAVVVGYGDGGLAIIDPVRRAVVGTVGLPAHPEGFQIDPTRGRAYVNVPDAHQIAIVDLAARQQIATWRVPGLNGNFPMALDVENGVVATVFRSPPTLVLFDRTSGAVVTKLAACGDADDVFFDTKRQRIYVSCGAGEIAIFHRVGGGYAPLSTVRTSGGARTSLFLQDVDRLFVAERASVLRSNAEIAIYRPDTSP